MGNLMKKGSDNLLNNTIGFGLAGFLIGEGSYAGVSMLSWIDSIKGQLVNALSQYMSWAGAYQAGIEMLAIFAIIGYIIDRV
jgi:hypothetical protein